MFKVRATLVAFLGDEEKYPCHMQHQIGDQIVFDGERYTGRLCPDVWPLLTTKVSALHQAGPRYVEPHYYYPFWYAPPSLRDPAKKKFDGLGFRNVLATYDEPQHHMATIAPPNAFKWPPHPERTVAREITITCPDLRTAAVFALEAFDLSDRGFAVPFFRRQMMMLARALKYPGIDEARVLELFTQEEREEIYPPLTPELLVPLTEELELMGYITRSDRKICVTDSGERKLKAFADSLTSEERLSLQL